MTQIIRPGGSIDGIQTVPLYLLNDTFFTALSAGSVNGTAAEPGPGIRTVVDTENKITIANGKLTFAGGKAVPAWGDPSISFPTVVRTPGRMGIWQIKTDHGSCQVGFARSDATGYITSNVLWFGATNNLNTYIPDNGGGVALGSYTDNIDYLVAIILRSGGAFLFIKGGAFTNWTLLKATSPTDTQTPLIPKISSNAAIFTSNYLRVPTLLWLPAPLFSTSGAMTWPTANGLGHAEGVAGGIGSGGSGLTLLDAGTWAADGTYVSNTPVAGVELVINGGFTADTNWDKATGVVIGSNKATYTTVAADSGLQSQDNVFTKAGYYKITYDLVATVNGVYPRIVGLVSGPAETATGSKVATVRADGTSRKLGMFSYGTFTGSVTNVSAKYISYSSVFTNCQLSTTDILAEQVIHARTAGTQVGMALNLDRSFAAKCNGGKAAGTNDISLKEISAPAGVALTTSDTVTIAGVTYAITAVGALANGIQTVTLASDCGVVATDVKVGLNWASWNGCLLYFDGAGNVKLDEVKAGAYTNRLSAAVTFVADKRLICRKVGTEYRVFYNDVLVGTTTAVDAAAMAGRFHGLFSTYSANQITSMVVYDTGNVSNAHAILDRFSN